MSKLIQGQRPRPQVGQKLKPVKRIPALNHEAKPDVCERCGGERDDFPRNEGAIICTCATFTAWLNPPHKSHRCIACNHVWRPADVPTNGVLTLKTSGSRDGNPRPRYFYTAKDYEDAVASVLTAAAERVMASEGMSHCRCGLGLDVAPELHRTDCRRFIAFMCTEIIREGGK